MKTRREKMARVGLSSLLFLAALMVPAAAGAEVVTLDDLRDCRRIVSISIKYSWVEDESSRIFSKHHFVFLNGRYEGYAYSAVKSKRLEKTNKIDDLIVPSGVMEAIAIILKDSPLKKLDYTPTVADIKRHPHYEISLELCTEGIKFFTVSAEAEDRWVVAVGDDFYVVGNDAPDSAIKVLEPFMHFEIVTDLKDEAFGRNVRPLQKKIQLKKAPTAYFKNIYFDYDDYSVRQEYHLTLFGVVDYLRRFPKAEILVAGHCDERGDEMYNIALGEKRASSVISHIITRGGDSNRIRAVSYGEQKPVDTGHNEDAWRKNRRVEFYVYDKEKKTPVLP